MSNFIDFLLVISKLQSPIYCRYPQYAGFKTLYSQGQSSGISEGRIFVS